MAGQLSNISGKGPVLHWILGAVMLILGPVHIGLAHVLFHPVWPIVKLQFYFDACITLWPDVINWIEDYRIDFFWFTIIAVGDICD